LAILFLLLINDVSSIIKYSSILLFADDTKNINIINFEIDEKDDAFPIRI